MVKSIGKSNAELRFVHPNNPAISVVPTNGYLKNLSKMHRYHKWVPMFVFLLPWHMAVDVERLSTYRWSSPSSSAWQSVWIEGAYFERFTPVMEERYSMGGADRYHQGLR